ncbi:hypothetical protein M5K25_003520 [Dendrobium thyrsiflorum]|uniref:Uncharacterized protein n=1 Tax=Dendrobium thyrsiflorum TaxID=117978 RepID=A0ABD0VJF9_DENTH
MKRHNEEKEHGTNTENLFSSLEPGEPTPHGRRKQGLIGAEAVKLPLGQRLAVSGAGGSRPVPRHGEPSRLLWTWILGPLLRLNSRRRTRRRRDSAAAHLSVSFL